MALPDEFDRHGNRIRDELIRGEIVKYPIQPSSHDLPRARIANLLNRYFETNDHLELTALVTTGFRVGEYDTYVPDVAVVENSRLRKEVRIIQGSPAIAIEVVAPADKEIDLRSKIDAYRQNGARTVWVVYPQPRSVMIYSDNAIREVRGERTIEDPLLPGFSVVVSEFFKLT